MNLLYMCVDDGDVESDGQADTLARNDFGIVCYMNEMDVCGRKESNEHVNI